MFSANDLIGYYKRVMAANGGQDDTNQFARLFLVPGMNHCGGGPALDQFDTLTAMENWVEKGQAARSYRREWNRLPWPDPPSMSLSTKPLATRAAAALKMQRTSAAKQTERVSSTLRRLRSSLFVPFAKSSIGLGELIK